MNGLGGKKTCKYYKTCGNTDNCKGCKGYKKEKKRRQHYGNRIDYHKLYCPNFLGYIVCNRRSIFGFNIFCYVSFNY